MVAVEVAFCRVVRVVRKVVQLKDEGQVAQPPQLHLGSLGGVPGTAARGRDGSGGGYLEQPRAVMGVEGGTWNSREAVMGAEGGTWNSRERP